jgi:hypothetical protein
VGEGDENNSSKTLLYMPEIRWPSWPRRVKAGIAEFTELRWIATETGPQQQPI